jgi:glycerophosphoryl diester phosphodiesterase
MNRPLLLGHRGARSSPSIPENTLASFELCLEHGCDGFEFDVRRSADGEAVVCHGATHKGMKIALTTAKRLALPTLTEVLERFSRRAFLDIELKVAGLESQTIAALQKHPPKKGYVLSSFLAEVLSVTHALDVSVPLGFLCEKRKELRRWRELPQTWVIPSVGLVDQVLIEELHAAGKKVMVWTVNRSDQMRRLAEWGVDAIITDETEAAARVLHGI